MRRRVSTGAFVAALVEKIGDALADRRRLRVMGRRGRKRIGEHFHVRQQAANFPDFVWMVFHMFRMCIMFCLFCWQSRPRGR